MKLIKIMLVTNIPLATKGDAPAMYKYRLYFQQTAEGQDVFMTKTTASLLASSANLEVLQ